MGTKHPEQLSYNGIPNKLLYFSRDFTFTKLMDVMVPSISNKNASNILQSILIFRKLTICVVLLNNLTLEFWRRYENFERKFSSANSENLSSTALSREVAALVCKLITALSGLFFSKAVLIFFSFIRNAATTWK